MPQHGHSREAETTRRTQAVPTAPPARAWPLQPICRRPGRTVVLIVVALVAVVLLAGLAFPGSRASATTVTFTAGELLGKPTDDSITINIVPAAGIRYYYQYGTTQGGPYTGQSSTVDATGGQPSEVTITGLAADTEYYYQMIYDGDGSLTDGDFETRTEHSFHTARATGSPFVFSVTSDGHGGGTSTWNDIAGELPDFDVDLGDTFIVDGTTSQSAIDTIYKTQRGTNFLGKAAVSVPIFLASGNHEDEEGWNLDDTPFSIAVGDIQARKAFFPTPTNGGFYSGNTDILSSINAAVYGDQLREDYYAWTWGDALFVVIDEFQYTMQNPYGAAAGEGSDDPATGDQWNWTLGKQQYDWLKATLEGSNAEYKFVFSHNMLGGINRTIAGTGAGYVRGGAEAAAFYEWGGKDASGNNIFTTKRPGWGQTIEQLFTQNGVSAYFHGHDHQYAYETRDGIVYQEVPSTGGMPTGFTGIYTQGNVTSGVAAPYNTIKVIANGTGHLRISVTSAKATVDYVSSGGSVAYSYDIQPSAIGTTHDLTMAVSPGGGGTTNPAVGTHSYAEGSVVDITATPAAGYVFDHWTGEVADSTSASTTVTMDDDQSVAAYFVAVPTVTINQASGQSDPANSSPINFTVVFSQPVTGFATGDVSLSGTAGATTAAVTGSGSTYNVAVSGMAGSGLVTATVPAGVAQDGAGTSNAASTSTDNSVTYDATAPSVTIAKASGQADPTKTSPIDFTVTFNEPVTGFAAGDVSLSGTAPGGLTAAVTGSGTSYNVAVSGMTGSGLVIASIPAGAAQDAAGNSSTASPSSATVTYDTTAPTVTIDKQAGQADPTKTSPIHFTVIFSEAVTGFTSGDIHLAGTSTGDSTTITPVGADNTTWTVSVSGMTDGTVIASIQAGAATDAAGNNNVASTSTSNTVTYDATAPSVTIGKASGQVDPTNTSPLNFTVVFSEPVSGFATGDVSLSGTAGATAAAVTGSGATYNVAVSGMGGSGPMTVGIPAGAATDAAGNSSTASPASATVTYDATAPTVTVNQASGQGDPTNTSPINFTVIFSEPVSGFATGDVSLSGTAGATTAAVTGSGSAYNVAVSGMTGPGMVRASMGAGAAQDGAGNSNAASSSTDNTVTYDATAPSVAIGKASGQADPTKTGPINFTVTFSESVTGFAAGGVSLSGPGSPSAAVTGSGTSYNVAVSGMAGSGVVVASIPAGAAQDAAGNSSTASPASATVTYDATAPTVTVDKQVGQADPTKDSPIHFTVTFSEAVSGFAADDLSFTGSTTGGTLAGVLTPVGSDNTSWTVDVSGMSHTGDVTVSLAAGAASDAAGNTSTASISSDNTVAFDKTLTLAVKTGWSLISAAPGTVFSEGLWGWDGGGFESVKDPMAWNGYWYKSTQDTNVEMHTVAGPKAFDLADGWNLIGNSMATPATVSVPQGSGLVVWAWVVVAGNSSFQSITTLQPGQGAWVKGTAGQQVTLTPAS